MVTPSPSESWGNRPMTIVSVVPSPNAPIARASSATGKNVILFAQIMQADGIRHVIGFFIPPVAAPVLAWGV
ncbi:hypothetical protein Gaha_0237_006 [Novacetimonas hansenii JCM 7643]|nr:hypothetical protein Gaha_0237_006 [Novacetimonas hansenii JCM 7643]